MSNYTKTTNFTAKDALTTGDPNKVIKGSEHDTEFDAIAAAIATKADSGGGTFTGGVTSPSLTVSGATVLQGTVSLTGDTIDVTEGGTGSSTASGARTNLGLGTISTQDSDNVSITGGIISGIVDLPLADGGTGASDATTARTNLGLGTISTLSSINNSNWSGTALSVVNGGTGATNSGAAKDNLEIFSGNFNYDTFGDITYSASQSAPSGWWVSGDGGTITITHNLGKDLYSIIAVENATGNSSPVDGLIRSTNTVTFNNAATLGSHPVEFILIV